MEVQSQRVWDYVGDEYVHRLVRSKVDGQHYLVEVPAGGEIEAYGGEGGGGGANGGQGGGNGGQRSLEDKKSQDVIMTSKLEAVTLEYNHLLTVQLGSQTEYFEEQLQEMRQQVSQSQTHPHPNSNLFLRLLLVLTNDSLVSRKTVIIIPIMNSSGGP